MPRTSIVRSRSSTEATMDEPILGTPYVPLAVVGVTQLDVLNRDYIVMVQRDVESGSLNVRTLPGEVPVTLMRRLVAADACGGRERRARFASPAPRGGGPGRRGRGDERRGHLSDRRSAAREPAAHVHRVLGADERRRVARPPATRRRRRPPGRRRLPRARGRAVGSEPAAADGALRSGPHQARAARQPRDGCAARRGSPLSPRHRRGLARRAGTAARCAGVEVVSRSWRRIEARPMSPHGASTRPRPAPARPWSCVSTRRSIARCWRRLSSSQTSTARSFAGAIDVGPGERVWTFTPERPWSAGRYTLRVAGELEDVAGNSLRRLFDTDLTRGRGPSASRGPESSVTRTFVIGGAPQSNLMRSSATSGR